MTGDPANARLWADADVFVSFNLNAVIPADAETPFGVDWDLVGLLDGDAGFVTSRAEEKSTKHAWGGIPLRTSRKNFVLTKSFTALETNETTRRLAWPGSGPGEIRVPKPERILIAFETRDGDITHRLISAHSAECEVNGDVTENETDLAGFPFSVLIYPDGTGLLWHDQDSAEGS